MSRIARYLLRRHRGHGAIALTRLQGDDFGTAAPLAWSVEFQRSRDGVIDGFLVNAGERNRDIRFVRQP